jgi:hypothetical protein
MVYVEIFEFCIWLLLIILNITISINIIFVSTIYAHTKLYLSIYCIKKLICA